MYVCLYICMYYVCMYVCVYACIDVCAKLMYVCTRYVGLKARRHGRPYASTRI